jgi:hypothetical protein
MPCYYAAVEVYDPEGPALAEDGMSYGGEARFFVLQAGDLSEALAALNGSILEHNLRLMRILHAGGVEQFDDEMLPFEVEIDSMVETAESTGEICVSDAHVFEHDETDGTESGVYAVCIDAMDPEWADEDEGEYAGHYQLAVIAAPSAGDALAQLLGDFAAEGISLLGLEGFVDAAAFPFDAYEFEFEEEDPVSEVQDVGGVILSGAYSYGPEAPRKLDS